MENKRQPEKTGKKILTQAYKKLGVGKRRHCGEKIG
jgi:hypothetical protein